MINFLHATEEKSRKRKILKIKTVSAVAVVIVAIILTAIVKLLTECARKPSRGRPPKVSRALEVDEVPVSNKKAYDRPRP